MGFEGDDTDCVQGFEESDPTPARSLSSDGASCRSVGADPPLSGEGKESEQGERVSELEERDEDEPADFPWPDLVLIDGGSVSSPLRAKPSPNSA